MINTLHLAAALLLVSAQNLTVQIFHVPMPPNWPVVVAPDIPVGIQLSDKAVFTWKFGGDHDGCTTGGQASVNPCVGRVADYVYKSEGTYNVTLTITDSSLKQPIVVSKPVRVFKQSDFAVAQRAEIRTLSSTFIQKWHDALYRLKGIGVYDHFIRVHIGSFTQDQVAPLSRTSAHGGPAFLPWHRSLTYAVERAIATAIGDDSVGMPYWDWTQGTVGLEPAMGPDGDQKQGGLLTAGPFCQDPSQNPSSKCPKKWQLPVDYPNSVKAILRSYGSDSNFKFQTPANMAALLNITNYDVFPFSDAPESQSFRSALEGWSFTGSEPFGANHNGVHRYIGGTMGNVIQSFNDPLFIIHHCQVDRMYTMWQQKNGCADGHGSLTCYRPAVGDKDLQKKSDGLQTAKDTKGNDIFVVQGHMWNSPMWPWNLLVSDMTKPLQGFKYLDPKEKPADPQMKRIDVSAEPLIDAAGVKQDPTKFQGIYPSQGTPAKKGSASSVSLSLLSVAFIVISVYLTV